MKKLMIVVLGLTCMAGMAVAGSIDSPGAPGSAASKMPAIGDIYTYLTTGTPVPTPGTSFTEPSSGPGSTGRTLAEIYSAVATPFPQCDAAAGDVRSGKKFFSTVSGSWGVQTGTLVQQQYCTLLKTGQTSAYQTGDDGYYSSTKGKAFSYSTGGDGTVHDLVTGLQWTSGYVGPTYKNFSNAIVWAEGLTQDSQSDWRLPNLTEIQSLMVRKYENPLTHPLINQTYFPSFELDTYWSSTTSPYPGYTGTYALVAGFYYGDIYGLAKTGSAKVIAVRGGE